MGNGGADPEREPVDPRGADPAQLLAEAGDDRGPCPIQVHAPSPPGGETPHQNATAAPQRGRSVVPSKEGAKTARQAGAKGAHGKGPRWMVAANGARRAVCAGHPAS